MRSKGFASASYSVRHALLLPFIILTVLGVSFIAVLSVQSGSRAVQQLASRLAEEVATEVLVELERHMEIPLLVNQINRHNLESGLVDLRNRSDRDRYFAGQMLAFPQISYSFFGFENAEFYGARRSETGEVELILNNASTAGASWYYAMTPQRDAAAKMLEIPNFDCRTRPWYIVAKELRTPVYSPVYRHFVYKDLAVTAAEALSDPNGTLLGVLGVDFRLDSINAFLAGMKAAKFGDIYIVERSSAQLIGNSLGQANFRNGADNSLVRLSPLDLDSALVQASFRTFQDHAGLEAQSQLRKFRAGGSGLDGVQVIVEPFRLANLDWQVFVLVPERSFLEPVVENLYVTIVLVLLVLFFAILAGIILVRSLFRPLGELVLSAGKLQEGNLDTRADSSRFVEWERLAMAFNAMASRLQSTIRSQEDTIQQRTRELADKNALLQEANRTKDQFFSIVAHDLRGPIGSLAVLLQTLSREEAGASPQHAAIMEQAAHHTRGIHEFLDNLLTWALSQQGKLECKPARIAVEQLQNECADLFEVALCNKQIKLETSPCGLSIHADPNMLRTVYRNLISNAIKFTGNGGTIKVSAVAVGNLVEVCIQDNGVGMDPETLDSLLHEGSAQSTSGTAGEKGSGLGLVLCKDFVERNGGTLSVQSAPGQGTTVSFTVPLAR